jgi:putative acetyltransferase
MDAVHRLATPGDARRLFEIRRTSILELAPQGMSVAEVQLWATQE